MRSTRGDSIITGSGVLSLLDIYRLVPLKHIREFTCTNSFLSSPDILRICVGLNTYGKVSREKESRIESAFNCQLQLQSVSSKGQATDYICSELSVGKHVLVHAKSSVFSRKWSGGVSSFIFFFFFFEFSADRIPVRVAFFVDAGRSRDRLVSFHGDD